MSDHNKSSSSDSSWEKLAIPPNEYDVLVTDINETELEELGEKQEIGNLSAGFFSSPAFPVNGVIHSLNLRFMVCFVCRRAKKPSAPIVNIWFLLDTGSPHTYLTEKSMESLFGPGNAPPRQVDVAIQDPEIVIECHRSHDHFKEVNILGANAILDLGFSIDIVNRKQFQLVKK